MTQSEGILKREEDGHREISEQLLQYDSYRSDRLRQTERGIDAHEAGGFLCGRGALYTVMTAGVLRVFSSTARVLLREWRWHSIEGWKRCLMNCPQ
jgi:hypothetical protein